MASIISMFHIDWKIIIAQAINFAIVFAVLYIYALKPLGKLMEERSQKIGKGIDDAKKNSELLKKTDEEYQKMIKKARAEADQIFENGKKEAEAKKAEMLESARNEVDILLRKGREQLEADKTKVLEEAKHEIASLAMLSAEKILGKGDLNDRTIKELSNI